MVITCITLLLSCNYSTSRCFIWTVPQWCIIYAHCCLDIIHSTIWGINHRPLNHRWLLSLWRWSHLSIYRYRLILQISCIRGIGIFPLLLNPIKLPFCTNKWHFWSHCNLLYNCRLVVIIHPSWVLGITYSRLQHPFTINNKFFPIYWYNRDKFTWKNCLFQHLRTR